MMNIDILGYKIDKSIRYACILHIDNLKHINYEFGYVVGNEVVQAVKDRIISNDICKGLDVLHYSVNRSIILGSYFDLGTCKRLVGYLEEDYLVEGGNVVKIFISVATMPVVEGSGLEDLLHGLERAVDELKLQNLKYYYYNPANKKDTYQDKLVMLEDAILEGRLVPFYQPILNNKTNRVEVYEALARIDKGNGDIINPKDFLDVAKQSKLYHTLTERIVTESFRTFKDRDEKVSINISAPDIQNQSFIKMIEGQFKMYPNTRVILELVEDIHLPISKMNSFIKELREITPNIEFALDDFGTGFSNFLGLMELRLDYLKIDGALVNNSQEGSEFLKVIKAVHQMCTCLNIKTVAEHISTEKLFIMFRDTGVNYSQGFHVGKPEKELRKPTPYLKVI